MGIHWAVIVLMASAIASVHAAEPIVGSIKTVKGSTIVERSSGSLPGTEGLHLLAQDVLHTAADGHFVFILRDNTRISLGPNSEMRVDQFVYEPAQNRYALVLDLAKGIVAYVSGKIAKFSPESVKLQTPVGILGVRGTHFAVALDAPRGVQ